MTVTDTVTDQPKRTGRPPLTDCATMLREARAIGFADLTVGKVTDAVGVKYSTFYRHFPSLDDLVKALLDVVLADVRWPYTDDRERWDEHLHDLADTVAATAKRWPGIVAALVKACPDHVPDPLAQACDRARRLAIAAGSDPLAAADSVRSVVCLALHIGPVVDLPADAQPPRPHRGPVDLAVAGVGVMR